MASGTIQSSGIAAMSVERYVVTLSIRLDGTAARSDPARAPREA